MSDKVLFSGNPLPTNLSKKETLSSNLFDQRAQSCIQLIELIPRPLHPSDPESLCPGHTHQMLLSMQHHN
ncbi:hypothetical protein RchiOBHm_Chr7g0210921 [Rosa chinensis]|uniref:Uncharacterized protein n=1 Tax=Rosa chinensis TaxID=74649 RepID=A0A2P6PAC1_ROSCH|nr:hypothetical protein RchiOBHm_Chr7g0210921 [Rosa chinensis]